MLQPKIVQVLSNKFQICDTTYCFAMFKIFFGCISQHSVVCWWKHWNHNLTRVSLWSLRKKTHLDCFDENKSIFCSLESSKIHRQNTTNPLKKLLSATNNTKIWGKKDTSLKSPRELQFTHNQIFKPWKD